MKHNLNTKVATRSYLRGYTALTPKLIKKRLIFIAMLSKHGWFTLATTNNGGYYETYSFQKRKMEIDGTLHSLSYHFPPISATGLQIPLILNFKSTRFVTYKKTKECGNSFYPCE